MVYWLLTCSALSDAEIAGIVLGVCGFILVLLTTTMCFCLCVRQRSESMIDIPTAPNLSTLDLVSLRKNVHSLTSDRRSYTMGLSKRALETDSLDPDPRSGLNVFALQLHTTDNAHCTAWLDLTHCHAAYIERSYPDQSRMEGIIGL